MSFLSLILLLIFNYIIQKIVLTVLTEYWNIVRTMYWIEFWQNFVIKHIIKWKLINVYCFELMPMNTDILFERIW